MIHGYSGPYHSDYCTSLPIDRTQPPGGPRASVSVDAGLDVDSSIAAATTAFSTSDSGPGSSERGSSMASAGGSRSR